MKVTINRAKWRCADHGNGESSLLNNNGERCCLGFLSQVCGVSDKNNKYCTYPSDLESVDSSLLPRALFEESHQDDPDSHDSKSWQIVFADLNDSFPARGFTEDGSGILDWSPVADEDREAWIAEGFKTILGIELEFTGEYPPKAARRSQPSRE